jgi:Tfp pilus assembly protein PilO
MSVHEDPRAGDSVWHLDKRVNISHIVATLMLAVSVFAWAGALDRRVAVIEAQVSQTEKDNQRQDQQSTEALRLMRDEMRDLRSEIRGLRQDLQVRK